MSAAAASSLRARRIRHRLVALGTSALVGFLVSVLAPSWIHGVMRLVASYDAGAATLLGFFLSQLHRNPEGTRARAAVNDPGRNVILLVVLTAVALGLVAAIEIIGHGPRVHNTAEKTLAYAFAILAVAIGWFLVHVVYTVRYAHLYWFDDDGDGTHSGGIRFPGTDQPSDLDFAYFSFAIGTSFAVSDAQVTETRVRAEIIAHSIISFAYNSAIIGMVINLFAGIASAASS